MKQPLIIASLLAVIAVSYLTAASQTPMFANQLSFFGERVDALQQLASTGSRGDSGSGTSYSTAKSSDSSETDSDSRSDQSEKESNDLVFSFDSNKSTVSAGEAVQLTWKSSATECSASGAWSGTKSSVGSEVVAPSQSSAYKLTCRSSSASQSKTINIRVETSASGNEEFAAENDAFDDDIYQLIQDCFLSDATGSCADADLNNDDVVNFLDLAQYAEEQNDPNAVAVDVAFRGGDQEIELGETAQLAWRSENAESCQASGDWSGVVAVNGAETVSPTTDATYTITCSNSADSETDTVSVTVNDDPDPIPDPDPTFNTGDTVQVNTGNGSLLNVRATPNSNSNVVGQQTDGAYGDIVSGPVAAAPYIWYNVNFDTGADGWVVGDYIQAGTRPAGPPVCTSFTYSDWGSCQVSGFQTRDQLSASPVGCEGGTPVLVQSCTYVEPDPDPTPASGELGDIAQSMEPGEFRVIEANVDNTVSSFGDLLQSQGAASVIAWANKAVWDPIRNQVDYFGSGHQGGSHHIRFDEATNLWTQLWYVPHPTTEEILAGATAIPYGHGYDHNALNPANGDFYFRPYSSNVIQKYNKNSETWTNLPPAPGPGQVAASIEYFPEMGGLVYIDGHSGSGAGVRFFNESTDEWSQLATGGEVPMGYYHIASMYNPVHEVIFFGGGNGSKDAYILDKNGEVTKVSDTPVIFGVNATNQARLTVDPVSGNYLLLQHDGKMYEYDLEGDTWSNIGTHPLAGYAQGAANWYLSVPISTYGVIMFLTWNYEDSKVVLYKHQEGQSNPDPIPDPDPTFSTGDTVQVNTGINSVLNVRSTPNGTLLGQQASGAYGDITDGPVTAGAYTWYNVNFDTGIDGWVVEDFIEAGTRPAGPPVCSSFTYSNWGSCQVSGFQTRDQLSASPAGCVGGTPVLVQSCTYVNPDDSDDPVVGTSNWDERAAASGVLMATRFDSASEVNNWIQNDSTQDHVSWEQSNTASGNGALRMDILKTDGAASGSWRRWLSDDQREFEEGDEFYVSYRQYFPEYFSTHAFNGGGWKQSIISRNSGEMNGVNQNCNNGATCGSNQLNEMVLVNAAYRGLVQGYNRSTTGHYPGWYVSESTACSGIDYIYQNAVDRGPQNVGSACENDRARYGGLYSYGGNTGDPDPLTGAFTYGADNWVSFKIKVKLGSQGSGTKNSEVKVWAAHEGEDWDLIIDRDNLDLGAGPAHNTLWLLPYDTGKQPNPNRENTYTLYDEVIVSLNDIAAPSGEVSTASN